MPITYRLDVAQRLVICTGQGVVTTDEIAALLTSLHREPAFDPSVRQFWELAEVTAMPIAFQDMLWIAGTDIFSPETPRAFHAPSDAVFGMARMFTMVRETQGESGTKVFRDRADAWQWLAALEAPAVITADPAGTKFPGN